MGSECKECERLWREYAAAKKSCLVLMSKLRIATFSHDAESIRELPPSSIAPEQPPRNAREAFSVQRTKPGTDTILGSA